MRIGSKASRDLENYNDNLISNSSLAAMLMYVIAELLYLVG